jgi:hypothetical protein
MRTVVDEARLPCPASQVKNRTPANLWSGPEGQEGAVSRMLRACRRPQYVTRGNDLAGHPAEATRRASPVTGPTLSRRGARGQRVVPLSQWKGWLGVG